MKNEKLVRIKNSFLVCLCFCKLKSPLSLQKMAKDTGPKILRLKLPEGKIQMVN